MNGTLKEILHMINVWLRPVRLSGESNTFVSKSKIGWKFDLCVLGNGNSVKIGSNCLLTNTSIYMEGEDNTIIIDDDVRFLGPCQITMGGAATLHIGKNTSIRGVEFTLKQSDIKVGERCMFSYGITIRSHDSHRVVNPETGETLNPPEDIVIGNHVWIAKNASVLKGVTVGEDSVVGLGAVVTRSCASGSILAGIPAKAVKENISWEY